MTDYDSLSNVCLDCLDVSGNVSWGFLQAVPWTGGHKSLTTLGVHAEPTSPQGDYHDMCLVNDKS